MATNNAVNTSLSGQTGTGTFVGATSPTIGTLIINGFTNGSSAGTGVVGEILSSSFASSVSISSNSATNIQSLSLTAGDWDVWAVYVSAPAGSTIQSYALACLNLSSGSVPGPSSVATASLGSCGLLPAGNIASVQTGIYPLSVNTTTSIYLNAYTIYSVSTLTGGGIIIARRRR
ncbi:hypothetical protein UFOVP260_30 [uncultured Caudovirales phage]|uniref:Uncharacterized protein n=1 Tax=uncultured Caudovirales phage TaxID=2100421 RepID=A0A6J5LHS8_9CAUD|nr:hypothetical protein UFOVP85_32 [uncultured Caudovirales phage]CAB4132510.1 hypothetical protein UFOVP260_30 [uncultured Caudovirales phage]CAB4202506.1 hypothetical protein UFOVP1363_15 [uncultured Caudovirales phage]CAB5207284.1 hypothetical protein UFOVP179_49 [uncultured Caudovirales phage]